MRTARRSWAAALAAMTLLSLAAPGCGKKVTVIPLPNQKPTVRLTHAPVTTNSRNTYAYRMNWVGFDPDGRVDHFVFAVDPQSVDRVDSNWVVTTKNEEIVFFRATQPDSAGVPRLATDPHVFAIRAVDDKGEESATASRAFFSFTVAPSVFVIEPRAGNFTPIVTPSVRIKWEGHDPDGVFTQKPVKYKFKLFRKINPDFPAIQPDFVAWAISNPDSFRRLYAPTFPGWDSTGAETTEFQYTNLQPGEQNYLFVVTGFDEAGAYDPVFSQTTNMLRFVVTFAGTLGPKICMFNEFFNYCYATGGYVQGDPARYYRVEIPAEQLVTFNWFAEPDPGASIRTYRWVLDLLSLNDETPRSNPETDWYHWSARSLNTTSATIGPFVDDNTSHNFFIEAEDNNGLRSLGIINFTAVKSTFDKPLLLVDDTRLASDQLRAGGGGYLPPSGQWPMSSELDSLFFARGGFPWRNYPAGTISVQGVFDGYSYDTIGTRGIANGILPLSKLGDYSHVIWYTDAVSASYLSSPLDPTSPITSLRQMSSPGSPSTLSTYIKQGGLVWLFGGGSAAATLLPWNRRGTPQDEFTDTDLELIPGRFMYDFAHWRSKVVTPRASNRYVLHAPFNVPGVPVLFNNPATIPSRGWQHAPPPQPPPLNSPPGPPVTEPTWVNLPMQLDRRTNASEDPLDLPTPPRAQNPSYYVNTLFTEFLSQANFIREDTDQNVATPGEESKLDTLYFATGSAVSVPARPVMTIYRGFESMPVVFTGIPIWYLRRAHEIALIDFVLGDLWRLPKPVRTNPSMRASRAPRE